ncbi:MAG: hypothetical protein ABI477_20150 [Chryseolinea sp.]
MKNILRYTLMILVMAVISCRDEDLVRFPDIETGVNARLILDPAKSFLDFADLSKASIAFDVYSVNSDLDKVVYSATYVDASDPTKAYPPFEAFNIPASEFVDGKAAGIEKTAVQLAQMIGLPEGIAHFDGGDNITFTAKVYLTDGRIFDASNSAPSITGGGFSSFTTLFTVYVGCASPVAAITGKTYTAKIHLEDSNGQAPFGLVDENTRAGVTITFVGPEPFRYRVSSHDAGWWALPDVTATEGGSADFFDICGNIIMQPKASFNYGDANDAGSGKYDPATGVITMNWYNDSNDIFGFVTYTPE